ncbi:MAG: carboxypeptidase-like regulatory domain-containing protein [Chitinophagales bacterium]
MAKPIKLLIPKPCSENWNEMTATERGAFCKACRTNVVDFTTKTESEIYDIIQSGQSHCGRFRIDQIDVSITRRQVNESPFSWKAIVASVLAFLSAAKLWASTDNNTKPGVATTISVADTTAAVNKKAEEPVAVLKPEKLIVEGKVVDAKTRKPLEEVYISVNNTTYHTITDENGKFSLEVDVDSVQGISFSKWGHAYTVIPLKDFKKMGDGTTVFKEVGLFEEEMKHVMGIYIKIPD